MWYILNEKTWLLTFCWFSWGVLFSHPADFTPVCTTELSQVQKFLPQFEKRGVKVIALSCDSVNDHREWIKASTEA